MVVAARRLEAGHCTAVSYDSHAWWGSRERPMSDVTSLVPCAQPQAPRPSPVMPVSCPLKSSQTHTQPTVLHGPWGAWHGPAWSGQAIPADALLGVSCWVRPVDYTSQAAGILERMNEHLLYRVLHPLFPSACHLRWCSTRTLTHTHRLSSGQKAHYHRDSHLAKYLVTLSSAATLPKPRLTDGALGRPSVRCLGKLQLKRPAATQMHEH